MPRNRDESDDSDNNDDDDSCDEQKLQIRKPKIQRLDKFKTMKKIVINVSMTQYPVVSQVAEQLNWKVQTNHQSGDWDIFWTDFSIDPDILIRMHLFQKINHYPGIHVIARKNLLGMGLMNLRNKFPEQYNFFPLTWMLPQQYVQFRQYYQNRQKGKCRTYIVKPEAQCQGRGIFLTRKIQDVQNGKHYVVQRYVARPYLIDGLKFDLRIYVLFAGTDPLRLYMYYQGLARFATQKYIEPCTANLDQQCVHLTNYAINKLNPKFIFNNSANNMGVGHKRSLTCVYKQLAAKGLNVDQLKRKIKDMTIKTIITGLPLIAHQYKCSQPQDYSGDMCFHVLGLDVMLNNKGDPFLIEVNHTPSFTTDTPLDYQIKHNLIRDTLVLMNISVKKKNQLFNKCKQYNQDRLLTGKRHIYDGEDRREMLEEAQAERDEWEKDHLGGFQKIFPTPDLEINNKYQNIIDIATKSYFEEAGSIRMNYEAKQAKRLIRSQIKKQKQFKNKITQKLPEKPTSQQLIQHRETVVMTPRPSTKPKVKTNISIRPQQPSTQSENFSPTIPKNRMIRIEKQLIRPSPGQLPKPPTKSAEDSQTMAYSTIRDIRARIKSKQSNTQMGKRPKNGQLPNIQAESQAYNNLSEIFNRSELIQKESLRKREQSVKSHDKHNLHSQPKPCSKLLDGITTDMRDLADKKGGGYVMPKIFCMNFEMERKMDLHYLAMSKKVQSTQLIEDG